MRQPTLLLALLFVPSLHADTSPRGLGVAEAFWAKGEWSAAANNPLAVDEPAGDVVAIRIDGIGESAMIRRRLWRLDTPRTIRWRLRWTDRSREHAFPSVHVLFDPPALDHEWWTRPVMPQEGGTGGRWAGNVVGYSLHLATLGDYRQCGVGPFLETAPDRHEFSPAKETWHWVEVQLERGRIRASVDGRKIAESKADLAHAKTFTVAFGDQCMTRVEVDRLTID